MIDLSKKEAYSCFGGDRKKKNRLLPDGISGGNEGES